MKVKKNRDIYNIYLSERQILLLETALGKLCKLESLIGEGAELASFSKGLARNLELARIAVPRKYKTRTKITLEEIDKINMLWFVNNRNRSAIARALGRSSQACEKYLFKTKQEWLHWSENLREG